MTNPRQRRRVKNPNSRVTRRAPSTKKCHTSETSLSGTHWDTHKTITQNYSNIGIMKNPNKDLVKRKTGKKFREWNMNREHVPFDSEDEIFEELESIFGFTSKDKQPGAHNDGDARNDDLVKIDEAPSPALCTLLEKSAKMHKASQEALEKRKSAPLSEENQNYIRALLSKHKKNYQKMFLDIKLNYRQLTALQLEKLALKLL